MAYYCGLERNPVIDGNPIRYDGEDTNILHPCNKDRDALTGGIYHTFSDELSCWKAFYNRVNYMWELDDKGAYCLNADIQNRYDTTPYLIGVSTEFPTDNNACSAPSEYWIKQSDLSNVVDKCENVSIATIKTNPFFPDEEEVFPRYCNTYFEVNSHTSAKCTYISGEYCSKSSVTCDSQIIRTTNNKYFLAPINSTYTDLYSTYMHDLSSSLVFDKTCSELNTIC